MPELLLVNPRRRHRRRKSTSTARRSRRSGPRRMTAKQAMYFGKRRHRRRARRLEAFAVNPRRGRGRRRSRRRVTHLRRNPIRIGKGLNLKNFVNDTLIPSGIGAAGALGLDVVLGYLSPNLPTMLTTGTVMPLLTRIAGAVALGYGASMVANRRVGEQVAAGAIIVTLYGAAKTYLQSAMPSLPLSGMGYYVGGMGYAGAAMHYNDLGVYVPGGATALPAPIASAIASRAAALKNQPPVGLHGEFSEGGYSYQ